MEKVKVTRHVGIKAPGNERIYPIRDIPVKILEAMSKELNFFGDTVDIGELVVPWEGHADGSFVMMEGLGEHLGCPIIVFSKEEVEEVKEND